MSGPLPSRPAGHPVRTATIETSVGRAEYRLEGAGDRGLVVLGHGAGGGIESADLTAVTKALTAAGWRVARVVQPYRVQGRRAPDRPPKLDAAFTEIVSALRQDLDGVLVLGGRSSGARVACRTATALGAGAVVCLAFPLHPPGRPDKSRADELALVPVPLLVVQGERDAFGGPGDLPAGPTVVPVPGDHSLRSTAPVAAAVTGWLDGLYGDSGRTRD